MCRPELIAFLEAQGQNPDWIYEVEGCSFKKGDKFDAWYAQQPRGSRGRVDLLAAASTGNNAPNVTLVSAAGGSFHNRNGEYIAIRPATSGELVHHQPQPAQQQRDWRTFYRHTKKVTALCMLPS